MNRILILTFILLSISFCTRQEVDGCITIKIAGSRDMPPAPIYVGTDSSCFEDKYHGVDYRKNFKVILSERSFNKFSKLVKSNSKNSICDDEIMMGDFHVYEYIFHESNKHSNHVCYSQRFNGYLFNRLYTLLKEEGYPEKNETLVYLKLLIRQCEDPDGVIYKEGQNP